MVVAGRVLGPVQVRVRACDADAGLERSVVRQFPQRLGDLRVELAKAL